MSKTCTIGELIKQGRIRSGDFIDYEPDEAIYKTNSKNTGYKSQKLSNCEKVNWRVVYVDEINGEILILPDKNLVEDVFLRGIIGYMNGPKELDIIASKLGSNKSLGTVARCPTIDDIYKIEDIIPLKHEIKRYAFYPELFKKHGIELFKEDIYERVSCDSDDVRFYTSDGGGIEETDENGFEYRRPMKDNPVFMTKTYYCYNIDDLNFDGRMFWLASPCVGLNSSRAYFLVRIANSSNVDAYYLFDSCGNTYSDSFGVRPLVFLNSELHIDIGDELMDGSSPEKAWKFEMSYYNSKDANKKTDDIETAKSEELLEECKQWTNDAKMYELFIIIPSSSLKESMILKDICVDNGFIHGTLVGKPSGEFDAYGNMIYSSCKPKDFLASGNIYLVEFTGELI